MKTFSRGGSNRLMDVFSCNCTKAPDLNTHGEIEIRIFSHRSHRNYTGDGTYVVCASGLQRPQCTLLSVHDHTFTHALLVWLPLISLTTNPSPGHRPVEGAPQP